MTALPPHRPHKGGRLGAALQDPVQLVGRRRRRRQLGLVGVVLGPDFQDAVWLHLLEEFELDHVVELAWHARDDASG
eukprot:scaffold25917_cov121-Isochrysis_galbana.AAC.2